MVSAPSLELFQAQDAVYKKSVLGETKINVAIEAAVRFGWDSIIGAEGIFIGMKSFGESAPYQELYKHFGITAENTVTEIKKRI